MWYSVVLLNCTDVSKETSVCMVQLVWTWWQRENFWFQTFAVFWMLYTFFWVIPRRLNFICRRFGTLFRNRKFPALAWKETSSVWITASHCRYWANTVWGYLDCGMIPVSQLHQANPLLVTDLVSQWSTGCSTLSATRLPNCTLQCAVSFFIARLELWKWGQ